MRYSQVCALLEFKISPVFMLIQHQVEAIPVKTSLQSLYSAATWNRKLVCSLGMERKATVLVRQTTSLN